MCIYICVSIYIYIGIYIYIHINIDIYVYVYIYILGRHTILLCFSAPNQNEHRIGKKYVFPIRCSFWLLSAAVCKTVCFPMTDLLFA